MTELRSVDGIVLPEANVATSTNFPIGPLALPRLLLLLSFDDAVDFVQFRLDTIDALLFELLAVPLMRLPVSSLTLRRAIQK